MLHTSGIQMENCILYFQCKILYCKIVFEHMFSIKAFQAIFAIYRQSCSHRALYEHVHYIIILTTQIPGCVHGWDWQGSVVKELQCTKFMMFWDVLLYDELRVSLKYYFNKFCIFSIFTMLIPIVFCLSSVMV